MDNLADELQAIASEPETSVVDEFRTAANRLVEALRDQFADGQVEALYSLQSAAAAVSRSSSQATEAGDRVTGVLRDLSERIAAEVASGLTEFRSGGQQLVRSLDEQLAARHTTTATALEGAATQMTARAGEAVEAADTMVTLLGSFAERLTESVLEGVRSLLSEATASIGEQLATEVDASTADLRGAAADHAQSITSHLDSTSSSLSSLQEGAEALTGRLTEAGASAQAGLTEAARRAVEEIRAGVDVALADAARAREEMSALLLDARRAAQEELTALRQQITVAESREESVAERLQQHVEQLVERTDATVGQSLTYLRGVADALLERDAQLEGRRADEFARVLESVLQQGGASTRKLRDRIFRGMERAKQDTPPASAPSPTPSPEALTVPVPAAVRPEPAAAPRAPAAKAPPKKAQKAPASSAPAKKAPAKKSPAKKAPAKKAPAAGPASDPVTSEPVTGSTSTVPPPEPAADATRPVQEEQA